MAETPRLEELQSSVEELKTLFKDELKRQAEERKETEEKKPQEEKETQEALKAQEEAESKNLKAEIEFRTVVSDTLSQIQKNTAPNEETAPTSLETLNTHLTELIKVENKQLEVMNSQYQTQLTLLSISILCLVLAVCWTICKTTGRWFSNILN